MCVKENEQVTDASLPDQVHEQNMQADQTTSSVKENEQVHELNTLVEQIASCVKENEQVTDASLPEKVHELNMRADNTASSVKENEQVTDGLLVIAGDGVVPPKKVHEVNMRADQIESSVKENEEVTDSHLVTIGDGVKDTLWNVIRDEEVAKIKMSQIQLHRLGVLLMMKRLPR